MGSQQAYGSDFSAPKAADSLHSNKQPAGYESSGYRQNYAGLTAQVSFALSIQNCGEEWHLKRQLLSLCWQTLYNQSPRVCWANCISSGNPCLSLQQQQPQHHHHAPQQQAQAQAQAQPAQQPQQQQQQQQARQMSGGMAGSQQRYMPPAQAPGSSLPASVAQLPSSLAGVNTSSAGQSMGHMPQVSPAAAGVTSLLPLDSWLMRVVYLETVQLFTCVAAQKLPIFRCLQGVHGLLISLLAALQMQYGPASGMPPGMSQYAYMPQYAASQYPAAYMPQAAYYAAAMPGNQYGGYAPPQGYAPNQPATSYAGGSGYGNHSYGKQQHSSYNHGEAAARLHDGAFGWP